MGNLNKENYGEVMLSLPPTSSVEEIVKLALEKGVPESYLRDEGFIK